MPQMMSASVPLASANRSTPSIQSESSSTCCFCEETSVAKAQVLARSADTATCKAIVPAALTIDQTKLGLLEWKTRAASNRHGSGVWIRCKPSRRCSRETSISFSAWVETLPPERLTEEMTFAALRNCKMTAHVSTKLNRSHLVHGKQAFIFLPCLGRTEHDLQKTGEQSVTVEDSMSNVHLSKGMNEPASAHLLSELAILAGIARATMPDSKSFPGKSGSETMI